MFAPKCRCSSCRHLVTEWIGDKCLSCYNRTITDPVVAFHVKIEDRLREVELENNRFWSSLVESYRNRFEVRMVDNAKHYVWYVLSSLSSIRFTLMLLLKRLPYFLRVQQR